MRYAVALVLTLALALPATSVAKRPPYLHFAEATHAANTYADGVGARRYDLTCHRRTRSAVSCKVHYYGVPMGDDPPDPESGDEGWEYVERVWCRPAPRGGVKVTSPLLSDLVVR